MVSGTIIECSKEAYDELDEKVIKESKMLMGFIKNVQKNEQKRKKHSFEQKDKEKKKRKRRNKRKRRRNKKMLNFQEKDRCKRMVRGKCFKEDNDKLDDKVIKESKMQMSSNKKIQRNRERKKMDFKEPKYKEKNRKENKKRKNKKI